MNAQSFIDSDFTSLKAYYHVLNQSIEQELKNFQSCEFFLSLHFSSTV